MNRPDLDDDGTLDVIVVTYHSRDWIADCLDSIPRAVGGRRTRVLVVDSASADDTVERVVAHGGAEVLVCPENRGFAAAVNRGMAVTRGVYSLLLNPDASLGVAALERLVERLDREPGLAAVAPATIDGRGTAQPVAQAQPTLGGELARTFAVFGRQLGLRRPDQLGPHEPPGWLSGACLLLRRAAWRRVGPFDAGYFLYFEETDWCRRALHKGYSLAVVEEALAVHAGGASSAGDALRSALARRRFAESRRRFFRRHHGPWRALGVDLLHVLRGLVDRSRAGGGLA